MVEQIELTTHIIQWTKQWVFKAHSFGVSVTVAMNQLLKKDTAVANNKKTNCQSQNDKPPL